jgi:hypothetical protein
MQIIKWDSSNTPLLAAGFFILCWIHVAKGGHTVVGDGKRLPGSEAHHRAFQMCPQFRGKTTSMLWQTSYN